MTNVEQMLKQEQAAPSNFFVPLFYLYLLSLPPAHWIAPDLLRFRNEAAWQAAVQLPQTAETVAQHLRHYDLLVQRLRWLISFLLLRANNDEAEEEASSLEATTLTPAAVLACLSSLSFREHLDFKVRAATPNYPRSDFHQKFSIENLLELLEEETEELFAQSLTILAQHGWIDVMPASPGNDLLIRLKRFPTRTTTTAQGR